MKYRISIEQSADDEVERIVSVHQRGATVLAAIFWTMLVLSTGVYVTWYLQEHKRSGIAAVGSTETPKSTKQYLAAIGRKILLPKDNTVPRVAIVTDPVLLTEEQEFYRGVEAGDVLVLFEESKRAILYSPRRDIIVNVGPIVPRGLSLEHTSLENLEEDIGNQ